MIYKRINLTIEETKMLWDGLTITRVVKMLDKSENIKLTIKGKWN